MDASRICLLSSRSLNDPQEIARHSGGGEEASGFNKIMSVESVGRRPHPKTESHARGLSLRTTSKINLHHGFLMKMNHAVAIQIDVD